MDKEWGASQAQWFHFAKRLGLEDDLLPIVANPNAEMSPGSTMKGIGKTPSIYNFRRQVVGLPKWTQFVATPRDIDRWQVEPDYGISIQCRNVRAIDIDIPDKRRAAAVVKLVERVLPTVFMPIRQRENSGKKLLAFRYSGELFKRVIPTDAGIIEILATGQQFVAVGTHDSGVRYEWDGGLPVEIPEISASDLDVLWEALVASFHDPIFGEVKMARTKRLPSDDRFKGKAWAGGEDEVADWLMENWEVHDVGVEGQLYLECPFADEHSSDSGATATAYFPRNTGGYERGHFVCLHAHCTGRDDREYLDRVGYSAAQFDDLTEMEPAGEREPDSGRDQLAGAGRRADGQRTVDDQVPARAVEWPRLVRDDKGRIEPTADNMTKALSHEGFCGVQLAYDSFNDDIMWAPEGELPAQWRKFKDTDYVRVRIALERRGFKAMGHELLRASVAWVGFVNSFDSAQEWLRRIEWDGKPRVERFMADYLGCDDSPYHRAVSRYVWSALAGRVVEPGVKADMVPIFYGAQGALKSTAIAAMAPTVESFVKLDMTQDDDKLARLMRGKLVAELEELRGLNTRDAESIKAWITRQWEEWVPKFKEFSSTFPRRLLLIGSTNEDELLADPTGERRWLPCKVALKGEIEVKKIIRNRAQLWAEGAMLYMLEGVQWQDAERLAKVEHKDFKVNDAWYPLVSRWLDEEHIEGKTNRERTLTSIDVACGAIGMSAAQVSAPVARRVCSVLRQCGLEDYRANGARFFRSPKRKD